MLFLPDPLVCQGDLISEFLQLMRILLTLPAALVFVALFQLFELCLLLISKFSEALSSLIQLVAQIFN